MDREQIFQQLRERIVGWATSSPWARSFDPEDLAQDVLLELNRPKYRDVAKLEDLVPLSYRILDYKVRNEVRKRVRRKEDQQMPIEEQLMEHSAANPEQRMVRREGLRQLATAVGRLKPKCRELLRLQFQHKSLKKISQLLDQPEGTIYSRWSRCRQALKKELRKLREQEQES